MNINKHMSTVLQTNRPVTLKTSLSRQEAKSNPLKAADITTID